MPPSQTRLLGASSATEVARRLVDTLGGRYSRELGIDVDAGDDEVERWFLAATLFGTRISAAIAARTFRVFEKAGLTSVADAGQVAPDELIELLDAGGYARYDFRTAARLRALSDVLHQRDQGRAAEFGRRVRAPAELEAALDALPGWGPVTVALFLRELRGVWPAADPPLDRRAGWAASHLRLMAAGGGLARLRLLAARAGIDLRDLEGGLVRLALTHERRPGRCPGGPGCDILGARVGGTHPAATSGRRAAGTAR